jgi:hypothetical protein
VSIAANRSRRARFSRIVSSCALSFGMICVSSSRIGSVPCEETIVMNEVTARSRSLPDRSMAAAVFSKVGSAEDVMASISASCSAIPASTASA